MKYLLILNPKAGSKNVSELVKKIMLHFKSKFLDILTTKKKGDAIGYAKASKHDVIIAAGGDGTVNEIINGIMCKKKRPKLAVLPIGTSNQLAKYLEMPTFLGQQLDTITNNNTRKLDVGNVNGRFFILGAGFGLDAHAFNTITPEIKKLFGEIVYPLSMAKAIFEYDPIPLVVEINKNKYIGYYVLVCNIGKYGNFELVKYAKTHDGLLDVLIFPKKEIPDYIRHFFAILIQQHYNHDEIIYLKAKKISIKSEKPFLAHADAEILDRIKKAEIRVKKEAISVIC